MNKVQVEQCIKVIEAFPPLPFCLSKLLSEIENDAASANDIARIISMDQALTANVLRLVNSAYYGYSQRISDITGAVVVLGVNSIKSLTLGLAVMNIFHNATTDTGKVFYWEHAIGTALAGRMLMAKINPRLTEEVFTAGLLHDVGIIVFLLTLEKEYIALYEQACKDSYDLSSIEKENIGIDHSHLGATLARKWHFPPDLINLIRYHHEPETLKTYEPKSLLMKGCVLYMANWISKLQVLERDMSECKAKKFYQIKSILHISDDVIDNIYNSLDSHIKELKTFFGL